MKRRDTKLYNILFPSWMFYLWPTVLWPILLVGNDMPFFFLLSIFSLSYRA